MTDPSATAGPRSSTRPMEDRVCVITGATQGIGMHTAVGLAKRGARMVLIARSRERAADARREIARAAGEDRAEVVVADLAVQAQVRRAAAEVAERFPRVDVLVNNAAFYSFRRRVSPDGIEMQLAVNHLAPFLLTNLLLPTLKASAPARIVTVSSEAHQNRRIRWDDFQLERRYFGFGAYGLTKLYNLLFTRELARRLEEMRVTANAMHPGAVATSLLMNGFPPIKLLRRWLRTPEQGAATVVWLASSPAVEGVTGKYFKDEREIAPSAAARDDEAAHRLWRLSEELTGLA